MATNNTKSPQEIEVDLVNAIESDVARITSGEGKGRQVASWSLSFGLLSLARHRTREGMAVEPWMPALGIAWQLAAEVIELEGRIAAEARSLAEHCERVAKSAESGHHLSSLGEIQSRGSDVDRLVIQRQALAEQMRQAANAAKALGAPEGKLPQIAWS